MAHDENEPLLVPPESSDPRLKVLCPYISHVVQLSMTGVLVFEFRQEIQNGVFDFFILYLAPTIILTIVVDISYLFCCTPPKLITGRLGRLNTLRGRGFIYQVWATVCIAHSCLDGMVCLFIGVPVWVIGGVLFLLGVLAHDFGFEDWVEFRENNTGSGAVYMSTAASTGDNGRHSRPIISLIVHVLHLWIVVLFLDIIIVTLINRQPLIFIIQLMPLIVILLAVELFSLCFWTPPKRSPSSPFWTTIWSWGFVYQTIGGIAQTISISGCQGPGGMEPVKGEFYSAFMNKLWQLGAVTWIIGLIISALGILGLGGHSRSRRPSYR